MVKKQAVIEVLKRIEKRDQVITPEAVVGEASDLESPIHDLFDWDDSSAAVKYRVHQARILINHVKVELVGKETEGYYNVKVEVGNEIKQGYVSAERVFKESDLHAQIVKGAVQELKYWQTKYDDIQELSGIVNRDRLDELQEGL